MQVIISYRAAASPLAAVIICLSNFFLNPSEFTTEMPVYTIYTRPVISTSSRGRLATGLTDLHCKITGAPRNAVKVMFIQIDSFFSGGTKSGDYVRILGQIRRGRTEEQKLTILRGMYELVHEALGKQADRTEIQSQIAEIDDTKSVMTNGRLNSYQEHEGESGKSRKAALLL